GASVSGNQVTFALNFPPVVRLGVLVRPLPGLSLELDGVYEGWSVFDAITLTPHDITFTALNQTNDLGEIRTERALHDAFSGRLGAEYRFDMAVPWRVRAGALYETSATPPERTGLDVAHFDRFFVTL